MSKEIPTASGFLWPECLTAALTPPRSGPTSSPSTADPGGAPSIWLSRVSRARTSATPAGARVSAKATAPGSGSRCSASFARFDPDMCSWRTSALSLFEGSIPFLGAWPKAGSMRNGVCSARPTWARPTSASGCSSWPTPDAAATTRSNRSPSPGAAVRPALAALAALRPTPDACLGADRETPETWTARRERNGESRRGKPLCIAASLWPTPTLHGNHNQAGLSEKSGDGLATAALTVWGTPTTSTRGGSLSGPTESRLSTQAERDFWRSPTCGSPNSLRGSGQSPAKRMAGGHAVNLQDRVTAFPSSLPDPPTEADGPKPSPERRTLNPLFVEWMQGFPIEWTACDALATPLSLSRLRWHLRCLLNG
jgi:hypothetical protein